MRVLGKGRLEDFCNLHADARKPINAWLAEAEAAEWENTPDIKARYIHASFLSDNRVVFNIKGNRYRLLVRIIFPQKIVNVLDIGTHAEYNKWKL